MTDLSTLFDAIRVILVLLSFPLAIFGLPAMIFLTIRDIRRGRERSRKEAETRRRWDEEAAQFGAKLGEATGEADAPS